jgi:di/tricarboxylate transporter/CRP-like cAMP-binding protein
VSIPHGAREAIARAAAELATVAPFSELAPVDRARLAAALEQVTFDTGDVIFAQGARADSLYILREGIVERQTDGVRLDVLGPSAVFGDMGLLRDEPRATTLIALSECVVWRLPGERFTRLVQRTPGIGAFFASAVSHRLAQRQLEVAELSQEFQGMAEHLYSTLDTNEQQMIERAALLPMLDKRVVGLLLAGSGLAAAPAALPLADILLTGRANGTDAVAYPPVFRRFLLAQMTARLGPQGIANTRRELAAIARGAGAHELAVQMLLDGDLIPEAVELADREVDVLLRQGHLDEARHLVSVLPHSSLVEHPHLQELSVDALDLPSLSAPTVVPRPRRWRPGKKGIAFLLGALILFAGWPLPPPEGLSDRGWHALVTLLAALPLLAVEALPDGIVALMLASAWVVGGVTAPRIALGGFATSNWVLVVSTLAVGGAIASSGLLYRLALWVVANSRGGYAGQVVGLGVAGMLIGPAVPNATSRVALVAPAVTELIDALGYRPGSRPSIGLAMAMLIGFGQIVALFLTSSTTSVLVYAVLPEASRASVNWGSWFLRSAPTHVILFGLLAAFIIWRYRPTQAEPQRHGNALALQRALLGPPSRHEIIAMATIGFVLVGFSTQPLHHIDPAWLGVVALAALAATGVLAANGLSNVNWSFVLLSGILTSMSDVFADTQLDKWLADLATRTVGGLASTPVAFVAALTVLCYVLSLVMRWQASAPLLTISLAPVGLSAGIDPWVIALIALMACNGFFLPYQSTTYLALYHGTSGRLFTHRQARPTAIAYAVATLVALCASVPLWRALGLL